MRLLAAALVALLCALAAPALANAEPPKSFYGVVTQDGAPPADDDFETMRAGGIGSIRLLAHWASIEDQEGTYDWTALDEAVRSAVNNGLEPMLFLWGTPQWAVLRDGYACSADCNVFAPASSETRDAFARFAAATVSRYGPGGEFWKEPEVGCPVSVPILCPDGPQAPCHCDQPAPLRIWQIWNEQNSRTYYAPVVNVVGYADLLRRSANAIRSVDPGAEVVLGGMWGPNSVGSDSDGRRVVTPVSLFLKRLYRVKGIKKYFDSWAIHPYAATLGGVKRQMKAARRIVKRAGDRNTSTWVTEIGWASDGPPQNPYVKGPEGQARLLTRSFSLLKRNRRTYRVRAVFWYAWRDKAGGGSICEWCGNAGLRDRDGSAKPSWDAFVRVAQ
jgi:hypothetical protein